MSKSTKSTISTFQLFEMFPDQETARTYLESRLWPEGPKCPVCGLSPRQNQRRNAREQASGYRKSGCNNS